ncbi:hypothetical protein [Novipirellula caenicola]|uniref:Alpha/beta hydrolase family protein n=1 Tax=Novipirellula caenicola TaxID=1536901 RepID=A0ABP9VVD8_9BACT
MNLQTLIRPLSHFPSRRFCIALIVTMLLGSAALVNASRADEWGSSRIWLVSTRAASSCSPSLSQTDRIKFWSSDVGVGWQSSTSANFFECVNGDPLPLCIYVHENRVSAEEAWGRAKAIYCQLQQSAPSANGHFRLVMISWPSDRIGVRPRPDAQIKAQRSEMHGYYLAWLLDQIDPRVPVSLFGSSYGPRLITAALHFRAGGTIAGYQLPPSGTYIGPTVRVALFASALDSDWLLPHRHHGRALTQVEHMLIAYNPSDSVLHWYPRLNGRGGPPALGAVGMATSCLGAERDKVQLMNVSRSVGKTHSWQAYEGSPQMMARVAPYLLRQSDYLP